MFHFFEDEKGREGLGLGGGGGRHSSLYFYVKLNFSLCYQILIYFYLLKERLKTQENIVIDTYCPTYNKGIFENQRKLKGGRVDKKQISLKCFRQKW